MRLPSQTYDTADLVRNMSIPADGPEEVVTAEEYLHPQGNNMCVDHMTSIKYHINGALEMVTLVLALLSYFQIDDNNSLIGLLVRTFTRCNLYILKWY